MKFKPFDRVLVRDFDNEEWMPKHYSRHLCGKHVVIGGSSWVQCIPVEGNEELCGTTGKPEGPLKRGDAVIMWDGDGVKRIGVYSHYDREFCRHFCYSQTFDDESTEAVGWDHVKKFAPAPVEDAPTT